MTTYLSIAVHVLGTGYQNMALNSILLSNNNVQ